METNPKSCKLCDNFPYMPPYSDDYFEICCISCGIKVVNQHSEVDMLSVWNAIMAKGK